MHYTKRPDMPNTSSLAAVLQSHDNSTPLGVTPAVPSELSSTVAHQGARTELATAVEVARVISKPERATVVTATIHTAPRDLPPLPPPAKQALPTSPPPHTAPSINPTITHTNSLTSLPVDGVVPLEDSNHELETSLSTVSASTSTPSASPVAANKADSMNNNSPPREEQQINEPSYQNTVDPPPATATAKGGLASSVAEENNNVSRSSVDKVAMPVQNGHGKAVAEEVDGVPKSPSVDARNNNVAAVGDHPTVAATPDSVPTAVPATGAVSKEQGNNAPLPSERMYNNLYDNQEMVVRMMTANLGRPEGHQPQTGAGRIQDYSMYDIPVSPPAGE